MKKYLLFVLILGGLWRFGLAQDRCPTVLNLEYIQKNDPARYERILQIEGHLEEYLEGLDEGVGRAVPAVIRIPVVVHVLHNGEPLGTGRNISMAQIESQIDVLNEDFRRLNADAVNTPAEFQPVAADPGVEFYLACTDPDGNPTNGVVRKQGLAIYTVIENIDRTINESATGIKLGANGSPAWPADRYLNIWIANLAVPVLGYAQFPDQYASKPDTDGVVVNTTSFGTTGNVTAPFDGGRTATHEVGHWLNLIHIFGSDPGCGFDDLVADTPVQNWRSAGCRNHPSVSCGSNDMFMNYMDYTDDACMNLFTQGQRGRMRALFAEGGVRRSFIDLGMTVSGPDRICTSATNFTLGNVPTGSTVSWEVSPIHLFPTAGRSGTGTTASLQAWQSSTSGPATLTFTVQKTSCDTYQASKQIWVGLPDASTSIVPNYQPICINEYTYFNAFYDMFGGNPPGNKEADITNFVWTPPPGVPCFTAGTKNEVLGCQFTSAHVGFPQAISVRAVNSCGQGAMSYANFTPSYCFYFSVGINPNPARGRVSIELTETPLDEEARAVLASERKGTREYGEYSFDTPPQRIRIFDITGVERLCVEGMPEGTKHELDISHLGPGVYVVHLEHRNGTVVRQLRVE